MLATGSGACQSHILPGRAGAATGRLGGAEDPRLWRGMVELFGEAVI